MLFGYIKTERFQQPLILPQILNTKFQYLCDLLKKVNELQIYKQNLIVIYGLSFLYSKFFYSQPFASVLKLLNSFDAGFFG